MQGNMIFPISEKEQDALGVKPEEFDAKPGVLGMMITPSRVREGIRRWVNNDSPNPFTGNETADVIKSVNEVITEEYEDKITQLEATIKREKKIFERRLQLRDEKVADLGNDKAALEMEHDKLCEWIDSWNGLQRFIARIFFIYRRFPEVKIKKD